MNVKYKGLSDSEVSLSRERNGSNNLPRAKTKSIVRRFFDNLGDPIIKVLIAALALEVIFTFGNCNLFEVFGIAFAILIATVVSTLSEHGSEAAFAKMEAESSSASARVIRNSVQMVIPADEVVVGDVILLSRGELVEADCMLLEGSLDVDQSALNGENREAHKSASSRREPSWELADSACVFRGSIITEGEGVARVGRVGSSTFYGMVARDVQSETRESPLKLRLAGLAKFISRLGYVAAALVGSIYIFSALVVDNGFVWENILASLGDWRFVATTLIRALTLIITVIVVAVPEGLPMMITVVLTANMRRMLKDNIMVKKLVGIETSGSLNILFTDKTGTLTEGALSVDRIITESGSYRTQRSLETEGKVYESVLLSARYNNSATQTENGTVGGNSTDKAIAEFFVTDSVSGISVREQIPFSSERKMSIATLSDGRVLVKGAPEHIFGRIGSVLTACGETVISTLPRVREEYEKAVSRGERVIAVAESREGDEKLVFVCLIVLKDKLRSGVKDSVREVTRAGIQIVMVTGDNKDTAIGIAEECGIFNRAAGHIALSSAELSELSDSQVRDILPRLRVVSRALPVDKTRLVRLSAEAGLVVGMTGDGINDAPSLKLADVGFAMGSGTDIAKAAGDILILDNSFSAICKAILYGRTIFKSIRKFISFQLVMNLAACGITIIGPFLGVDTPITIIQMLWVNIIMDTLGGLAFAGEAPMKYYMKEKPKKREEPIVTPSMVWQILANGGFTLVLLATFLTHPFFRGIYPSVGKHLTAFYVLFIFSGIFNCLAARSERLWIFNGILKNKLFMLIMGLISLIQLVIVYFGGSLFRSTPLLPSELVTAILVGLTVLVFDSVRRIMIRLK